MPVSTKFLRFFLPGLIISCSTIFTAFCQNTRTSPVIDTNARAMVFAPGVVSTPFDEGTATFTPDGNTVYFYSGAIYMAVCFSKMVNGIFNGRSNILMIPVKLNNR